MSINDEWNMVKEFHIAANHPTSDRPIFLPKKRLMRRIKWMLEEIDELKDASNIYEQVDALIDLIYFALGTLVEMGVPPKDFFKIVHQTNMQKIKPDSKVITGKDGKILKPKDWVGPQEEIKRLIDTLSKKNI